MQGCFCAALWDGCSMEITPSKHRTVRPISTGGRNSSGVRSQMPQAANEASASCMGMALRLIHRRLSCLSFVLVKQTASALCRQIPGLEFQLCQLTDCMTPASHWTPWEVTPEKQGKGILHPRAGWWVFTHPVPGSQQFSIRDRFLRFILLPTVAKLFTTSTGWFLDIMYFIVGSPGSVVLKVWGLNQQHQYHLGPC